MDPLPPLPLRDQPDDEDVNDDEEDVIDGEEDVNDYLEVGVEDVWVHIWRWMESSPPSQWLNTL